MSDLAGFLAARLDEDERIARAAIDDRANGEPESWHWECTHDDTPLDVDLAIAGNAEFLEHADCYARIGLRSVAKYPAPSVSGMTYGHLVIDGEEVKPEDCRHIARHDPARVLREVESKRKILNEHAEDDGECQICSAIASPASMSRPIMNRWPCRTVKFLAASYSDHPSYQEEWKP